MRCNCQYASRFKTLCNATCPILACRFLYATLVINVSGSASIEVAIQPIPEILYFL
jgi:hypothetical protein